MMKKDTWSETGKLPESFGYCFHKEPPKKLFFSLSRLSRVRIQLHFHSFEVSSLIADLKK